MPLPPAERRRLCSVVASVYNEEANLREYYRRFAGMAAAKPDTDWELILVDDGSRDRSFAIIRALSQEDSRVKGIRFSRNFGPHETSIAGLRYGRGDAAVLMGVDLQDPPELIADLVTKWQEGHDVVWAVREGRQDPWLIRAGARLFYRLVRWIGIPEYPPQGTGGFCLLSRPVIDAYNAMPEHHRVTFEVLYFLGFSHGYVGYFRPRPHTGRSKWGMVRRVNAAINILLNLSRAPIRLIASIGALTAFTGIATLLTLFGLGAIRLTFPPAWTVLLGTGVLFSGLQLLSLGILGEYLWRTFEEARGRPLFVVRELVGDIALNVNATNQHPPGIAHAA